MFFFRTKYASFYTPKIKNGHMWYSKVICNGSESNLSECSYSRWGTRRCGYGLHDDIEDVGVSCFNGTEGNKIKI